jgi:hypothetical protein
VAVGVKERELVRSADGSNDGGSLVDLPETFSLRQLRELLDFDRGEVKHLAGGLRLLEGLLAEDGLTGCAGCRDSSRVNERLSAK